MRWWLFVLGRFCVFWSALLVPHSLIDIRTMSRCFYGLSPAHTSALFPKRHQASIAIHWLCLFLKAPMRKHSWHIECSSCHNIINSIFFLTYRLRASCLPFFNVCLHHLQCIHLHGNSSSSTQTGTHRH